MITVDTRQLIRALDLASAAIPRRTNVPVLRRAKLVANGKLAIEGSDLDTFTRAELPYTGSETAFTLLDPLAVRRAIAVAGGESTQIEPQVDDMANVRTGDLSMTLREAGQEHEHPGFEAVDHELFSATISAAELRQIARIMSAISREEIRYYLNGLHIVKVGNWTWRFQATDGHRLMWIDVPMPDASGAVHGAIIPRAWLRKAKTHFSRSKEPLRLTFGHRMPRNEPGVELDVAPPTPPAEPRRLSLSGDFGGVGFTLAGKLIDGAYPDVERVIPKSHDHSARIATADLTRALHSVSAISGEKTRAVKLAFPQPGNVLVSLNSAVMGEAEITIPAEHDLPAGFEICFNARYLLDMIAALGGKEVVIGLTASGAPATFTNPADTAIGAVLMPMRF